MSIDLGNLFTTLGIVGGNTASNNQKEFYYGIEWNDATETYNQYEFFEKIGVSRKVFFETYALNEREFYRDTTDVDIVDYKTFYENAGQYLGGGGVSDWILTTGDWNDSGFWRDNQVWID